ncbi:Uncharacterised protein [Paenibacillus thiaminolyticus]|nr:Uncharacterised protein [Paenibacillus thiaminolyticus]
MRWIPARWSRKWIQWELWHALVLTLEMIIPYKWKNHRKIKRNC